MGLCRRAPVPRDLDLGPCTAWAPGQVGLTWRARGFAVRLAVGAVDSSIAQARCATHQAHAARIDPPGRGGASPRRPGGLGIEGPAANDAACPRLPIVCRTESPLAAPPGSRIPVMTIASACRWS